jgi:hypothetical protein
MLTTHDTRTDCLNSHGNALLGFSRIDVSHHLQFARRWGFWNLTFEAFLDRRVARLEGELELHLCEGIEHALSRCDSDLQWQLPIFVIIMMRMLGVLLEGIVGFLLVDQPDGE